MRCPRFGTESSVRRSLASFALMRGSSMRSRVSRLLEEKPLCHAVVSSGHCRLYQGDAVKLEYAPHRTVEVAMCVDKRNSFALTAAVRLYDNRKTDLLCIAIGGVYPAWRVDCLGPSRSKEGLSWDCR